FLDNQQVPIMLRLVPNLDACRMVNDYESIQLTLQLFLTFSSPHGYYTKCLAKVIVKKTVSSLLLHNPAFSRNCTNDSYCCLHFFTLQTKSLMSNWDLRNHMSAM